MGKTIVTGAAGFIGSHLVDSLSQQTDTMIIGIDNLSNGTPGNLAEHLGKPYFKLVKSDLKNPNGEWTQTLRDTSIVYHYAANPEVKLSTENPEVSFEENLVASFNLLEAIRKHDVEYLVFASTSTVYGDAKIIPTPEDYHPLRPISIYGATKLAVENLIHSYTSLYGIRALILRYANIIGPRSNHGVIIDFTRKLRRNPRILEILGDGTQRKSYLHVTDAVNATLHLTKHHQENKVKYEVYNIGSKDWITVREIADIIVEELGLQNVKYKYKPATSDGRGWLGDVKQMLLDTSKLEKTGWKPKYNSREAVRKTIREILGKPLQ
ncbi:MAG: NAD-dependent epimerase/dehydratase family protein [Desulfurococcales archaeon]|nr:NAD-dependent epimerase/dehydratase family protein [Desulfurococcales archaeon]